MPLKQYDLFLLSVDLNTTIKKGMQGVILEVYDDEYYEVEFVKEDGTNYQYNGDSTFTIQGIHIEV